MNIHVDSYVVFALDGWLCLSNIDGVREAILEEAITQYVVDPRSTKTCHTWSNCTDEIIWKKKRFLLTLLLAKWPVNLSIGNPLNYYYSLRFQNRIEKSYYLI